MGYHLLSIALSRRVEDYRLNEKVRNLLKTAVMRLDGIYRKVNITSHFTWNVDRYLHFNRLNVKFLFPNEAVNFAMSQSSCPLRWSI